MINNESNTQFNPHGWIKTILSKWTERFYENCEAPYYEMIKKIQTTLIQLIILIYYIINITPVWYKKVKLIRKIYNHNAGLW